MTFKFGDVGYSVKVIEIIENKLIIWVCVDADEVFKEVVDHETVAILEPEMPRRTILKGSRNHSQIESKLSPALPYY